MKKILAYDLGTGGCKACLYTEDGICIDSTFICYQTIYNKQGWHEQRPCDWWDAVVDSTKLLLKNNSGEKDSIYAIALSGHSLGAVPIDKNSNLLRETAPIWSDTRSKDSVLEFFDKIDKTTWYSKTGNGFVPECYPIFKAMWYRDNEPDMYKNIYKIVGSKDYINLKLTGEVCTDYSYASGSGAFDLVNHDYVSEYIDASGLKEDIFPKAYESIHVVRTLTKQAADELSLNQDVKVVTGGVDNSCMAVGAGNIKKGRIYTSLGSSAWIAVTDDKPLIDTKSKPFTFAHVIPHMYTSAFGVYSAGSSLKWVANELCKDLAAEAHEDGKSVFELMNSEAQDTPVCANNLIFNPAFAGQTTDTNIRGAFFGFDLRHTRKDIIRAAMEGIAMELRMILDEITALTEIEQSMYMVGGGSKSDVWRQIFADIYNMKALRTNIGQNAGALGAFAAAAVGCGLWSNFDKIDEIIKIKSTSIPNYENVQKYENLLDVFKHVIAYSSIISKKLREV